MQFFVIMISALYLLYSVLCCVLELMYASCCAVCYAEHAIKFVVPFFHRADLKSAATYHGAGQFGDLNTAPHPVSNEVYFVILMNITAICCVVRCFLKKRKKKLVTPIMADGDRIVINSLLCFVFNSYKKHTALILKSILRDFYVTEAITAAKERLLNDIESLKLDKWIRPPARRGDNKVKNDIDDILGQFHVLDERGLFASVPKYATANLDELPMIRMERGEFAVLVSKLDKLGDELAEVRRNALSGGSHHKQPPPMALSANPVPNVAGPSNSTMAVAIHNQIREIRQQSVDGDIESSDVGSGMDGRWEKQRVKKRKLRTSPTTSPTQPSDPGGHVAASRSQVSTLAVQSSDLQRQQQQQQSVTNRSRVRVIGRLENSDTTNSFKAAKPIVKKAVYAIYNCDLSETAASLGHFVQNVLKVGVISCFETNLYQLQRRTRAFRLCINAKDNATLLNPDHWADGIVIKAWRFTTNDGPRPAVRATSGNTAQESSAEVQSRSAVAQPPLVPTDGRGWLWS